MKGDKYLLLLKNDAAGAARMLGTLTSGFDAFSENIARFGGTVHSLNALIGEYDVAAIASFEDRSALAAFCVMATAQGQYVVAFPALDRDELESAERITREAASAFGRDLTDALRSADQRESQT